jgi:flagellar hook-length control protein FliK
MREVQRDVRRSEPAPPEDRPKNQPKDRLKDRPAAGSADRPAGKAERGTRSESRQDSRAAKGKGADSSLDGGAVSPDTEPTVSSISAPEEIVDTDPADTGPANDASAAAAIAVIPVADNALPAAAMVTTPNLSPGPDEATGIQTASPATPGDEAAAVGKPSLSTIDGKPAVASQPSTTPAADTGTPQAQAATSSETASAADKVPAAAAADARPSAAGQHKNLGPSPDVSEAGAAKLADVSLPNATQNAPHGGLTVTPSHHAAATGAAHAAAAQTAATPAPVSVPVSGLAVEIAAHASAGKNRFEIRLDPPELGKIDVRLDIDKHGHVTSRLIVEKAETLDLLRRDAPQLERALQDAGLKTSGDGLQFSLQQQTPQERNEDEAPTHTAELTVTDDATDTNLVQRGYARLAAARGGVDIRI